MCVGVCGCVCVGVYTRITQAQAKTSPLSVHVARWHDDVPLSVLPAIRLH